MSIKLALTREENVVTRTWTDGEKTITAKHYREPYELKSDDRLLLVKEYSSLEFMGVEEAPDYNDDEVYVSLWVVDVSEIHNGALRLLSAMELDLPRFLKTGSIRDLFQGLIYGDDRKVVIGAMDSESTPIITFDPTVTLWGHILCRLLFNYVGELDELPVQRELAPSLFSVDRTEKMVIRGVDGTLLLTPEFPFENVVDLRASIDTSVEIGKTYKVVYGKPEKFTLTVIRHSKLVFEVTAIDF